MITTHHASSPMDVSTDPDTSLGLYQLGAGLCFLVCCTTSMLLALWLVSNYKSRGHDEKNCAPLLTPDDTAPPSSNDGPPTAIQAGDAQHFAATTTMATNMQQVGARDKEDDACMPQQQWRCDCENNNGFLPPGLLQRLGPAESMVRMSWGQCYHKKKQR